MPKQAATATPEEVLSGLSACAQRIRDTEESLTELYAQRLALYKQGREMDPPITQRVMAEHAGVTEVAVIQALRKARNAEAASA